MEANRTPVRVKKKEVRKADGRRLIYYHFPATASPEQTAAFQNIEAPETTLRIRRSALLPSAGEGAADEGRQPSAGEGAGDEGLGPGA